MTSFLVAIDFPSIKKYVFGTDAAREIRGASALLDRLNVEEVPNELARRLGAAAVEFLYRGGGAGMFIARSSGHELRDALAHCSALVRSQSDGGLELLWGAAELAPGTSFGEVIREAHRRLRAEKQVVPPERPIGRIGVLAECSSCSVQGVSEYHQDDEGEEGQWICRRCDTKRQHRESGRAWRELVWRFDPDADPKDHRHADFAALSKESARPGALALVYMDGDGLGALIQTLAAQDQYTLFSNTVDASLKDALFEVLKAWRDEHAAKKRLPIDVLLLGGDDLVFVTRAEFALPFAAGVSQAFTRHTKERLARGRFQDADAVRHGLSVSAGVALFKSRQPLRTVLDQAESLLRSAKLARADAKSHEGWVDFHDVRQSRFVDLDHARRALPGASETTSMTLFPMPTSGAKRFLDEVKALRAAEFGVGHAKRLASIVESGRAVGFETRRMLARGKPARTAALRRFFYAFDMGRTPPWRVDGAKRSTGVLDLATVLPLYERVGGGR